MKKHLLKIFTFIFGFAILLTGCATVSNVNNESKDILYYGGSAVTVGGYTYFANAYTPYSSSTEFDYKTNSNVSYLARIDNSNVKAEGKDFSPSLVEKVAGKVTGFQNQDMFVLGDYIYFTSMNTHQNSSLENNYSLITLWRCKLNGDGLKELYTTEYFSSGKFAPVGDAENGYYWICYTGAYTESSKFSGQVISIKLGNSVGKAKIIAEEVLTAVFADVKKDGSLDKVIYTTSEEVNTQTQTLVYGIDYSGENKVNYNNNGKTINLVDKVRDDVFYTSSENSLCTYIRNVEGIEKDELFDNGQKIFVYNNSISGLKLIKDGAGEGYLYVGGSSKNLMYVRKGASTPTALLKSSDYTDILFVDEEYVYYSNATSISRISVLPSHESGLVEAQTIVTMTDLQSGQYGFDGNYLYFFAKLEDVELEGDDEENSEEKSDDNYYMYRVAKGGGDYQLIGKTLETRKPKKVEEN